MKLSLLDLRMGKLAAVLAIAAAACNLSSNTSGAGGQTGVDTPAAIGGSESPVPATLPPAINAAPGEIVVQGDLNMSFQPVTATACLIGDTTLMIAFVFSDNLSGVSLFMPANIQPGTHALGDLFHLIDDTNARFDYYTGDTTASYESLSGTLVLTEIDPLSGSYNFTAVKTPEGILSVTVAGNFAGIPRGC